MNIFSTHIGIVCTLLVVSIINIYSAAPTSVVKKDLSASKSMYIKGNRTEKEFSYTVPTSLTSVRVVNPSNPSSKTASPLPLPSSGLQGITVSGNGPQGGGSLRIVTSTMTLVLNSPKAGTAASTKADSKPSIGTNSSDGSTFYVASNGNVVSFFPKVDETRATGLNAGLLVH